MKCILTHHFHVDTGYWLGRLACISQLLLIIRNEVKTGKSHRVAGQQSTPRSANLPVHVLVCKYTRQDSKTAQYWFLWNGSCHYLHSTRHDNNLPLKNSHFWEGKIRHVRASRRWSTKTQNKIDAFVKNVFTENFLHIVYLDGINYCRGVKKTIVLEGKYKSAEIQDQRWNLLRDSYVWTRIERNWLKNRPNSAYLNSEFF